MKRYRDLQVWHGDNYGIDKINGNYARMYSSQGNQQEGVGIYFSSNIDVAYNYGSKVVTTYIDTSKLVDSRESVDRVLNIRKCEKFLNDLFFNRNQTELWYMLSDYVEVTDENEVTPYHFKELMKMMKFTEVRNFQLEIMDYCDVKNFVESWLSNIGVYGTYKEDEGIYCLMYNKQKLIKL